MFLRPKKKVTSSINLVVTVEVTTKSAMNEAKINKFLQRHYKGNNITLNKIKQTKAKPRIKTRKSKLFLFYDNLRR